MPLPDLDSTVGWSYGFEWDNFVIKQIQEVSGLKMETDVIELKHNTADGKYINKKLPGRPKSGEITMTRGVTDDTSFEDWMKKSLFGDMSSGRAGGSVIMYDFMGQEVKRYKLNNAWPKSLEIGTMKAGDTSVLTEKLTVTHEGCEPG